VIDELKEAPGAPDAPDDDEPGKARALTLHILRMFETRMDAAGIALQTELHAFSSRLQLKLLAAAAFFLALWGGIVLVAIALPPHLRIPVLAGVVAAFVVTGVWALIVANRAATVSGVGSMNWFIDNLKQDVDVLARSLAQRRQPRAAESADSQTEPPTPAPEPPPTASETRGGKSNEFPA
jgi:uncharacterized membrane protein YqjE